MLYAGTYGRGVYTTPLLPPPRTGAGIEGAPTSYALGTFTAPSGSSPYTISINWGDGTPPDTTTGTATLSGTTWTVSGTHTFADDGMDNVTATVRPTNGLPLALQSTIDVNDATLTTSPQSITGTSMTPLSNALVATFTDADTASSATDFTASIDWSDGTTSTGTITGSNGSFDVYGTHTYTDAGSFPVNVTIEDVGGGSATDSSTATISGSVSAQPVTVAATEGASTGTVPVSSFMSSTHGPFTAAINWGDGNLTAGTIAPNGSGGYSVSGSNTYGTAGSDPLTVSIFNNGTLAAVISNPVTVADAPLSPSA
jgi:hypothetical protein